MKEKPTVGSALFWTFPSDRIPKTANHVNVRYIHSFNTRNSYIIIPANFGKFLKLLRSIETQTP